MPLTEFNAETGAAMPDDTAEIDPNGRFELIPLTLIAPSLTNPRKTFDAVKLDELATSIRISGVHQPVLVRPLPGSRLHDTFTNRQPGDPLAEYELVCGERRYRASKLASLAEIPAVVRSLTDDQVLEIQIVENLQRDDLSELEEAEGYAHLCEATGIDKSAIGERIGRSRSYVYARLKLLDLCQQAREALRSGQIDASKGLLISRIPDEKLQIKALKEFTATAYNGDHRLSYREAQDWIRQNVMLKLQDARFDITDLHLITSAGPCGDCPKRTGANPDLFTDVDSPDICTDPTCYQAKTEAHTEAIVRAARAKGIEVIEGKEAKAVRPYGKHGPMLGFTSADASAAGVSKPLRELLTKNELKNEVKLLIDPETGESMEVISDALVQVVRARQPVSKDDKKENASRAAAQEAQKVAELQAQFEKKWRGQAAELLIPKIKTGAVNSFEPPLLREILNMLVDSVSDDAWTIALPDAVGEDGDYDEDTIASAIAKVPEVELGQRICIALLLDNATRVQDIKFGLGGRSWFVTPTDIIESLAKTAGIDLEPVKAAVKGEFRSAQEAPAARQTEGQEGEAQPTPAARAAAKPKSADKKTSIEEATTGIAAAMQSLDVQPAGINAFLVGQRVRFKIDLKGPGGKIRKCCGKEGVIKSSVGDRAWSVSLGSKPHETAIADYTEIEVVEEVPA